jgi:sporulation protein YlmC with PRC-barrel domain
MVPHALAQQSVNQPRVGHAESTPAHHERLGVLTRSSELIGSEIVDSFGNKLGTIRDLAVNLPAGRVLQVIVSSGGVFGFGVRNVGVPASLVAMDGTGRSVASRIDRETFLSAPAFDDNQWSNATRRDQVSLAYRHFAVEPRFHRDGLTNQPSLTSPSDTTPPASWKVERASKLVGMNVFNAAEQDVGEVEDIVVDLAAGRVNTVLVASGGFLGVGEELSAIPPSVFRYDPDQEKLTLQVSRDALSIAPRYRSDDWSRYSNEEAVRGIYQAYGLQPYFDADNTRINVRDRDNRNVTPFDQGASDADVRMTRDIRRNIVNAVGLTVTAQNVKVITQGGHVILRGPVTSVGEKKLIEQIARQRAGTNQVESQLEVQAADPDDQE